MNDNSFYERLVRGLREKVQELHELSDAKDRLIGEAFSKAAALKERLGENDAVISALRTGSAADKEELSRLQGELGEKEAMLAELEARLREKDRLLKASARKLEDTAGRLDDMAMHLQYAQKVLADVHNSRTWRLGQFYGRVMKASGLTSLLNSCRRFLAVALAHGKTHLRILRNEGFGQYLRYAYRYRRRWLAGHAGGLFRRLSGRGKEPSGVRLDTAGLNYRGLQEGFRGQFASGAAGGGLEEILQGLNYRGIVVYPAPIPWNIPLYQRPHHLLKELSQRGYLVFYLTPDAAADGVSGFREISERLYVVSSAGSLAGIGHLTLYLWITWTPALVCREFFPESVLVYDWIDELDVFYPYCGLMEEDHKVLLREADLVITSSQALAAKAKAVRYDVVLARNGVNIDDFRPFRPGEKVVPGDLAGILARGKPVVGFYGSLEAWRMDYELINYLCSVCGDLSFVLIGPSYDGSSARLAKSENLFLLGPKKYGELKQYLAFVDVAIIPYLVDRVTNSVFPVKLCEYMAAGKPVVSTGLRECRDIGAVFISEDYDGFAQNIRKALEVRQDQEFQKSLRSVALANTWQRRVDDITAAFDRILKVESARDIAASKAGTIKGVVIYPPTVDWNLPLFQRPHHLALQLSKLGYLTFYCTGNHTYDHVKGFRQLAEHLYLTDRYEQVTAEISGSGTDSGTDELTGLGAGVWLVVSSISSVSVEEMRRLKQKGYRIIYDYLDEIHEDISGGLTSHFAERHRLIDSSLADLVLVISARLGEEMKRRFPEDRIVYLPNGVDYDHFHREKDIRDCPEDLSPVVEEKKPVIGYHGAFARWIDYDLISYVAEQRPGWNILLIGWDYDGSMNSLKKRQNIKYLGLKQYHELPAYSIWFDVAIIPFMEGDIAKATSPIKLFEYMAMNKPTVVTRDLIECRGESVFRGDGQDAFVVNIETALALASDAAFISAVDDEARRNTWEVRGRLLDREMGKAGSAAAPANEPSRFESLLCRKWGVSDLSEVTDPLHAMWIEWALSTFDRGEGIRALVSQHTRISGKRCMDVGCGYGGFLVAFSRAGAKEAVGLELNPVYFDYYDAISEDTGTELKVQKADVRDMRALEGLGKFDIITCNDVIEHVDDPETALSNIAAMLEPGGLLFLQIPNRFHSGFIEADGHFKLFGITLLPGWMADIYHSIYFPGSVHDVRYCGLRYYLNILRRSGLTCTVTRPAGAGRQVRLEEIRKTLQRCSAQAEALDDRIPQDIRRKIRGRVAAVNRLFLRGYERQEELRPADPALAYTLADRLILTYGEAFWQILCKKEAPGSI